MKSKIKTVSGPPNKPEKQRTNKPVNLKIWYVLIVALAFVLYGNTIPNDYSVDDTYVTSENPMVQRGIRGIPTIFTSNYITMNAEEGGQHTYGYRPIAKATYAIEWQIFGENPHVSHFINILLYAFTGLLLFKLLLRLLKNHHVALPLLTVLFFMVHPLHTEVVASLKNREELLSFLGGLLSLQYFLKYYDTHKRINILWALLCFGLGFMSKVNIMTFLLIIPLTFYFFTDIKPKKIVISTLLILGVMLFVVMIPRFFIGTSIRPIQFIENPLHFDVTLIERIGTSFMALLFYLKMLIFPHPLVFYYGFDMIPVSGLSEPLVWLSILLHLGLFGYAIYTIRQKTILSFAILFYLISISIFSNFLAPPTGIVAERFLYIASLGFSLALAYGLFKLFGYDTTARSIPSKTLSYIVVVALFISIPATARTIDRNSDWKTSLSLYEADMPYLEKSAKANFIYATNLRTSIVDKLKSGMPRSRIVKDAQICIKHFKRAVDVYPQYPDAWNNLGETYLLLLNEADSSIKYFQKAIETNPNLHAAYYNLGYTYQITEQYEKAIIHYERALELEPWEVRTMSNLAQMYQKVGNNEKSVALNEDIIKIEPLMDVPYINLGAAAMKEGDAQKAIEYFEQAIKINPSNYDLSMRLRNYYLKTGDSARADYYLDIARRASKMK